METLQLLPSSMLGDSALLSTFDAVEAALSTLGAYRLELLADLDQRGLAVEQGAHDTIEFLSLRHHRNRSELRQDLKIAHALPKYRAVTAALPNPTRPDDGPARLNPAQAKAIITTLEKAPATVPDETLRVAEEQMIEAAHLLTPDDLLDLGRQVLDRLDTDGPEPAENDAAAKESLTLRRADGGVKFNGYLAGENAELFQTQINRLSKPHRTVDGALDPRPHPKRQADALTTIMNTAAAHTPHTNNNPGTPHLNDATPATPHPNNAAPGTPDLNHRPGTPHPNDVPGTPDPNHRPGTPHTNHDPANSPSPGVPHITITIDLDDLRTATTQAAATSPPAGELIYGNNLSAGAVRRLACDANILPIVLGSDSQPLDVGTEHRFVTRHIRRALNKRDKGCVICKAPPWHCHAHHLIHWIDGGPTSITNLVLLCATHHRAVHAGHWTITITNGTVHVTRPTWTTPNPTTPTDLANLTDLSRYRIPPNLAQPGTGIKPPYGHAARLGDPSAHSDRRLRNATATSTGRSSLAGRSNSQPIVQPITGGPSWLTPEATALLDPWGDSGTPSAGP